MRLDGGMAAAVRERSEVDLEACTRLLYRVHNLHRYPIHWPADPTVWLSPPGVVAAWVALRENEIVGHVCITSQAGSPRRLMLERLFVSTDAVGQGAGGTLVTQAMTWARQQQQPRLALEVADNCDSAIRLYARMGWCETGRTQINWGEGAAEHLIHFQAP
jgi:GNAT superfamily N-acetyltransferase